MIQGNFHRFISAKTIRASGDHSDFVIQALDNAAGDLTLGPEPVQQQALMGAEHAESVSWRRAFGIMPIWASSQSAVYKLGPQAFVAWASTNATWIGGAYTTNGLDYNARINVASAFARNLANDFYYQWLNLVPLAACIYDASNPQDGSAPLPVPQWSHQSFQVSGNDFLGPYSYSYTSASKNLPVTSPIYVVGHSGLMRYGADGSQDNLYHDPADHP